MKRLALLLPPLALAGGCITADVRVFDKAGNPVGDALVLRDETWTSGCCLWPTVWSTHVAALTDGNGLARLPPRNPDRLSSRSLVILSPDLTRYHVLRLETDDLPSIEEFRPVDFSAETKEGDWMRDLDRRRLVFREGFQDRASAIYCRWHRLRSPHNATQGPAAEESHAESAENAEPEPHAESAEGAE